jgi:hypothetical protein
MLNDINGYTRTCGLIGNPVEHTLSPVIHNTLSMVLGENLAYVPFHVENGRLEDAVKGAFALNLLGLNVTVPYKSDVIPYLTDIDPLAENIGAVNTLVRTETGYKGYNTDMPGLYRITVGIHAHTGGLYCKILFSCRKCVISIHRHCFRKFPAGDTIDFVCHLLCFLHRTVEKDGFPSISRNTRRSI